MIENLNVEDANDVDHGDNQDDDDGSVEVIDDGVDRDGGSKLKVVAVDRRRRCLQWQFRLISVFLMLMVSMGEFYRSRVQCVRGVSRIASIC